MADSRENSYEIAIVGISARFPKSPDYRTFWKNLEEGRDCITRHPEKNRQNYIAAYGKVDDLDMFDADFFKMNQREANISDPQQRFLLEGVYEALEDAGYDSLRYDGKIGLYTSCDEHIYVWNCISNQTGDWYTNYQLSKIYADGTFNTQIAYKLNLQGPAALYKYACASSLTAVHYAYQGLLNYECDIAVAGGVSIEPEQEGYYCFDATVSQTGYTRTFDRDADGFIPGCGQGVVILKRLEDAIEDHDHIYAVIKGTALNNDGNRKAGLPAPSVQGQEEALLDALDLAEVTEDDIDYFESHGTATVLGDSVELRALKNVFADRTRDEKVLIGSVKTNIGHTNVAAGIANVIKTALMLHHRKIVPSLYYENPNDELDESANLKVADKLMPFPENGKRAVFGVSAFGLGGANAIAVMAEAPQIEQEEHEEGKEHVFVVSGKTQQALKENCANLAEFIADSDTDLENAAFTLQEGRGEHKFRKSVTASGREELAEKLRNVSSGRESQINKKIVFIFSGVGSGSLGTGVKCYRRFGEFRKTVDECMEIAEKIMGKDLKDDFLSGRFTDGSRKLSPAEGMVLTFITGYALARLWISLGVRPDCIAGHSLGEYTGACAAGMISPEDAVRLIYERAELFETLPEGTMFNLALSEEETVAILTDGVEIGAVNGRKRTMISGSMESMENMARRMDESRIPYSRLGVDRAGHCSMVGQISDAYRKVLSDVSIRRSVIPVFSTYLCRYAGDAEMTTPDYWIGQMCSKVRFHDAVEELAKQDNTCFIEIGTSDQMSMLARKSLDRRRDQFAFSSFDQAKGLDDEQALLTTAGRLWECGVNIKWDTLYDTAPYRTALPTYAFQRKSYWKYRKRNNSGIQDMTAADDAAKPDDTAAVQDDDCRNDMDRTIKSIFLEVLGMDSISTEENLYELGFDSLSTILISSKIESATGQKISMNEIYSVTTIREISDLLAGRDDADCAAAPDQDVTEIKSRSLDSLFDGLEED